MVFEYENVLFRCCREGLHEELVRSIEDGQDVNTIGNRGMTPLMYAAIRNFVEGVRVLIYNGAIINQVDDIGFTALKYAEQNTADDVIALLNSEEVTNIAVVQEANQADWPQSSRNPTNISPYFQNIIVGNNNELNRIRQEDLSQINNLLEESNRILDRRIQQRNRTTASYQPHPGLSSYNPNRNLIPRQRNSTYDSSNIYRIMNQSSTFSQQNERSQLRTPSQVQGVRNRPRWNNSTSIDLLPQINQVQSYQPHSFINSQSQRDQLSGHQVRDQNQQRVSNRQSQSNIQYRRVQRRRATTGESESQSHNNQQQINTPPFSTFNYNSDNEMGFDQNRIRNQIQSSHTPTSNPTNYNSDNEMGFDQNRLGSYNQQNITTSGLTMTTNNVNERNDQDRSASQIFQNNTSILDSENYNSDNEMGRDQNNLNQIFNNRSSSWFIPSFESSQRLSRLNLRNPHTQQQNRYQQTSNQHQRVHMPLQEVHYDSQQNRLISSNNSSNNNNENQYNRRSNNDEMVVVDLSNASNRYSSSQSPQNSDLGFVNNQISDIIHSNINSATYGDSRDANFVGNNSSIGVDTNDLQVLVRSTMTQYDDTLDTSEEDEGRCVISVEVQTDVVNDQEESSSLDQYEMALIQQISLEDQLQSTCVKQDIYIAEQMQALMYLDEVF